MAAGQLYGRVDGLTSAHPEDNAVEVPGEMRRQPLGQQGAVLADEVVVADVQLLQGLAQGGNHAWVAVSQVEDAAVAVAVDQRLLPSRSQT